MADKTDRISGRDKIFCIGALIFAVLYALISYVWISFLSSTKILSTKPQNKT